MKAKIVALSATLLAGLAGIAHAQLVLTYSETPGATLSSLANTSVETFENISLSGTSFANGQIYTNLNWAGVGTYDTIAVRTADQYGGAGGTGHYSVQSTNSSLGKIVTTTLTLDTPSAYFGLWWSAGDSKNKLEFYSATGQLIASFTTATLLNAITSSAYNGNPFGGGDSNEKFAFLNFYGEPGTTWKTIVFTNDGTSGFESDNHTSRVAGWGQDASDSGPLPGYFVETVSGTSVSTLPISSTFTLNLIPEPGTGALAAAGAASLALLLRRKRKTA